MADPNFQLEYRLNDSDNDLLRKILTNLRNVILGGASIDVNLAPESATAVNGGAAKTDAAALAANPSRRRWGIQNSGTNPLTVTFDSGVVILAPCTSQDDGRGGSITDDLWRGAVTVDGTSIRYNVYEIV